MNPMEGRGGDTEEEEEEEEGDDARRKRSAGGSVAVLEYNGVFILAKLCRMAKRAEIGGGVGR